MVGGGFGGAELPRGLVVRGVVGAGCAVGAGRNRWSRVPLAGEPWPEALTPRAMGLRNGGVRLTALLLVLGAAAAEAEDGVMVVMTMTTTDTSSPKRVLR